MEFQRLPESLGKTLIEGIQEKVVDEVALPNLPQKYVKCPVVHNASGKPSPAEEFQRIREYYPLLSSTGCTPKFCQSGRMIHTDEPRVGQNRSLCVVQKEAVDFLCQLRRDNIITSDENLRIRTTEVVEEIRKNATWVTVKCGDLFPELTEFKNPVGLAGGTWNQKPEELEHGIRLAWKHSRKCIMRSEYEGLKLCDLRHVTSSAEMGQEVVKGLREAFNQGDIIPTVFVFPPRSAGRPGPMFWNHQLLSFAGYSNEDGTILGDPLNADLTKEIINLGWKPSTMRTRWDLLPLVTMAENDKPVITEIPQDLFPIVQIRHPDHELAFEKLGLRWVPAPALSRLGIDIGGVQYTASPFVGWFMDAEIGVRDLADQARYNVLPRVVEALGWPKSTPTLEEVPEYERLALLSRAQAELNYAVFSSYSQAEVRMSDTLTASSMYCTFDDEHLEEYGFRLPADPYWLAPPQGSIVPLWHRGGAPHYQPKPLICRHVQDPVNTWKRRIKSRHHDTSHCQPNGYSDTTNSSTKYSAATRSIHIHYCSAGSTAQKLAHRLHSYVSGLLKNGSNDFGVAPVSTANSLRLKQIKRDDIVLLIASSCGRGEIPVNGRKWEKPMRERGGLKDAVFAVFGNGNSTYTGSYNGAAQKLVNIFTEYGARPLAGGLFEGDTATEDPPWTQLDTWWRRIRRAICVDDQLEEDSDFAIRAVATESENFSPAKFVSCTTNKAGIKRAVIDVGDLNYEPMSHVAVIVPNTRNKTKEALRTLGLHGKERLHVPGDPTCRQFLTDYVDFELPFKNTDWASRLSLENEQTERLAQIPVSQSLKTLPNDWRKAVDLSEMFASMPLTRPRVFSAASSQQLLKSRGKSHLLEFLVHHRAGGLFSDKFLCSENTGTFLRLRLMPSNPSRLLLQDMSRPIIAFATGSGIAPVRSLLQWRIDDMQQAMVDLGPTMPQRAPISLLVGYRPHDTALVGDAIHEAIATNLFDMVFLTPSNASKVRAQDKLFVDGVKQKIVRKLKEEEAYVFVCAPSDAAMDFAVNLTALLGRDVKDAIGERYIEEVFEPGS